MKLLQSIKEKLHYINNYFMCKNVPFIAILEDYTWLGMPKYTIFDYKFLKGWKDTTYYFLKHIANTLKEKNLDCKRFKITDCKEKFGSLRIEWEYDGEMTVFTTTRIDDIIKHCTERTSQTCCVCGKKGDVMSLKPWMRPYCTKHYMQAKEKHEITE